MPSIFTTKDLGVPEKKDDSIEPKEEEDNGEAE